MVISPFVAVATVEHIQCSKRILARLPCTSDDMYTYACNVGPAPSGVTGIVSSAGTGTQGTLKDATGTVTGTVEATSSTFGGIIGRRLQQGAYAILQNDL